jgi:peroxiredoxin
LSPVRRLPAILAALGAAAIARGDAPAAGAPPVPAPAEQRSALAPDFSRPDLSGRTIRLSDYRGKVVLLNFWATWCAPCLAEVPRFSRWQSHYGGRGLQVLGVSMDDDARPAEAAYRRYRLAYPVAMGDATLGELYGGVLGLPLTYIIDPAGRIVARYQGEADLAGMERQIVALLAARRP